MKNMRFCSLLVVAILVSMVVSGCKKDGTVSLRAKIANFGNESKVYLDNRTPRWSANDPVNVNDSLVLLRYSGSNPVLDVSQAPTYWAVYPNHIVTSFSNSRINLSIPQVQTYEEDAPNRQVVKAPMAAYSRGEELSFTNLGALLAINIVNNAYSSITVSEVRVTASDIALWGDGYVDDYQSDNRKMVLTSTPQDHNEIVVRGANNASLNFVISRNNSKTVYVYVPATESANKYSITVVATSGSTDVSNTRTQSNSHGGTLPRNCFAVVPFNIADIALPEGALSGVFTVTSGGVKVRFSQGNLQYKATAASGNKWRFATNQWDYVGDDTHGNVYENGVKCNNALISSTYSGWIDLFGWGANGYNDKHPYTHTDNESDYGIAVNNVLGYYEWGRNPISNGGNADNPNLWRSLAAAEWNYLLNTRRFSGQRGNGYSYSRVTINNVWGLLLYPDDFLLQTSYNDRDDLTEVPDGCVFLPGAGRRDPTGGTMSFPSVGGGVYYWLRSISSTASDPNFIIATSSGEVTYRTAKKYYGQSVRLVQYVE